MVHHRINGPIVGVIVGFTNKSDVNWKKIKRKAVVIISQQLDLSVYPYFEIETNIHKINYEMR